MLFQVELVCKGKAEDLGGNQVMGGFV